jgi:hypothetical protein
VRLQLFSLAYNLANFLRRLALPRRIERWSLTTFRENLINTAARTLRHARHITVQMAAVAVPRALSEEILARIARLTPLCHTGEWATSAPSSPDGSWPGALCARRWPNAPCWRLG